MTQDDKDVTRYELKVPEGHTSKMRLDKYITSFIENTSRTKVQQAIEDGYVTVNGVVEKSSYRMMPDDFIEIELPVPPPPEAKPENIPVDIVYEDDHLLIVNKPAGMVVHPAYANWTGTLVNALMYHIDQLSEPEEDTIRPGIVHRLDKDTSGLLVVAKNNQVHKELASYFKTHKENIERTYWALIWGVPDKEEGTITGNIGRSPKDRKIMTVRGDGKGKEAATHYEVIEHFDHLTLVKLTLETGRTHQIRVHMQHEGHPVFGDPTYGGDTVRYGPNTGSRKAMYKNLFAKLERQCLHAKTLGFEHPVTRKWVQFDSELPADFQHALKKLRRVCK